MEEGAAQNIVGEREIVVASERLVQPGEEAYRYRLKAPVFTGLEDVEQFIQEFREVIDITQWPPRVAFIQLRMILREQAKLYGLGDSVEGIFTALWGRFGISVIDEKVRLQGLRASRRSPIQNHATKVKKLAQIAYSDFPEAHRERYTYDAFVQSLNDLGLHHQLQAKGLTTIEDALRKGEAYFLAKQLHRAHVSSQQITVEFEPDTLARVAAATTHSPLEAEVDRMAAMLEKLVAILACTTPTELTQGPVRPWVETPRPTAVC